MVLRPHSSSRSSASFLDTLSFSLPRRHRRTIPDLPKDPPSLDVDALIAISVAFPIDSLTEEEIEAAVIPTLGGGGSADQSNYISVRNQILAKWRLDVCPLYLPDGKAVDSEVDSRVEAAFNA